MLHTVLRGKKSYCLCM